MDAEGVAQDRVGVVQPTHIDQAHRVIRVGGREVQAVEGEVHCGGSRLVDAGVEHRGDLDRRTLAAGAEGGCGRGHRLSFLNWNQ